MSKYLRQLSALWTYV